MDGSGKLGGFMCGTMAELYAAERSALAELKTTDDRHLQMLYGQWALEAQRMQRFHAERCEECRKDGVKS
jgi:hypothetical protein